MANPKRKYKVTTSTETRFVTPINDEELVYSWKKESGKNKFTKELKTKLSFYNNVKLGIDDFDFFYSYESDISKRCEEITCEIYKTCNGVETLEFTGTMPLISGQWDIDGCQVSIKLESKNSVYDCIENNKQDTDFPISFFCPFDFNTPAVTTNADFYLYDIILGTNTYLNISEFNIGAYVYDYQPWPYGGGSEVRFPYGLFSTLCYTIVQEMLIKCGRDNALEMLRSDYFDWNAKGDTPGYIASAIPKLDMNMGVTNYPIGSYPNRFIYLPRTPGINYVTGNSNKLTHLLFMPKSNANDNTASSWEEPLDSSGEPNSNKLPFEEIEKIWETVFNAYWFIDTDGCMRVEHISWFIANSFTYDSTTTENMKFNKANRKYAYKSELAPRKEIFKFSANRDFLNGRVDTGNANKNNEILYDSVCVNPNKSNDEKEYTLTMLTTDYKACNSKNDPTIEEFYDNKGLMLFTCDFGATYNTRPHGVRPYDIGETDGTNPAEVLLNTASPTTYQNGHLQWANLIRRYLKDNRVLTVGKNGAEFITFTARTVKTKQQKNVILKYCCDLPEFDPNQSQVLTELGLGDISEAEYSTKTELINITALHD